MSAKLRPEELKAYFSDGKEFNAADLAFFYDSMGEPDLNKNTLLARIFALKQKGIISSKKRGIFVVGGRPWLQQLSTDEAITLQQKLTEELPHINTAVWDTSRLFRLLEINTTNPYLLAEVDKEATETVFSLLCRWRKDVFLNPDEIILRRYASMHEKPVLVSPLISEAPLEKIGNHTIPSLEKLIVDLQAGELYLKEMVGNPTRNFIKLAFENNIINHSSLQRYASRRGCIKEVEAFLRSLNINLEKTRKPTDNG
ncbi:MAG: hypothetical protein LAT67_01975 [Balneolales bacterium]|nr:hypothetical protein [Balneolales bacterium]